MVPIDETSGFVAPATLHERLKRAGAPTVIDVRGAEEYRVGHIPGALHIPADELRGRLAEVVRGRPVVTY